MKLNEVTYPIILRHSVAVEAGYVCNKNDPGGETNCGITYATAQEWKADLVRLFNWDGQMINLTTPMAEYIYEHGWWNRLKCDQLITIHPLIAQRVFDFGINAGRSRAGIALQTVLNCSNRGATDYIDLVPDGAIGQKTIDALKAFAVKRGAAGLRQLLIGMASRHMVHYQDICVANPKLENFYNGWSARLEGDIELYYQIYSEG